MVPERILARVGVRGAVRHESASTTISAHESGIGVRA
jgi:hypothetical protein